MICTAETKKCPGVGARRECCRRHVVHLVDVVGEVLDRFGVEWWLDYGALLGAVREGRMIAHDKDADLGFLGRQWDVVKQALVVVEEQGHVVKLIPPHPRPGLFRGGDSVTIYLSRLNKTSIELFPWYATEAGLARRKYFPCDQYKGREFPPERLLPTKRVQWEGVVVAIPQDAEWFVAHRYGENWRTPIFANNDGVPR